MGGRSGERASIEGAIKVRDRVSATEGTTEGGLQGSVDRARHREQRAAAQRRYGWRMLYRAGAMILKPVAQVLYRPAITGVDNIPPEGGVILASNHLSFIDSFAIPLVAPRKVSFLAKAEYFTGAGPVSYTHLTLPTNREV